MSLRPVPARRRRRDAPRRPSSCGASGCTMAEVRGGDVNAQDARTTRTRDRGALMLAPPDAVESARTRFFASPVWQSYWIAAVLAAYSSLTQALQVIHGGDAYHLLGGIIS